MKRELLGYLAVVIVAGGIAYGGVVSTQEPSLFTVGESVGFVVDCIPEVVVPMGSSPCFNEVVTIRAVRADNWLVVVDEQGSEWFVNPARVYSFKRDPYGKTSTVAVNWMPRRSFATTSLTAESTLAGK